MKQLKKAFCLILGLVLVMGLFAACTQGNQTSTSTAGTQTSSQTSTQSSGSDEPYKIAMIAPFTGDSAQYGNSMKNALEYVVNGVNDDGGVNGHKIVIEYFDDRNDATESVSCAQRVVSDADILACFGPWSSTCALAAAPILEDAGILLIAPASSHADFTSMGEYMVRGTLTNPLQMKYVSQFLYNFMGFRKGAMLYQNNDVGSAYNELFKQDFTALGGEVVASETFLGGDKDFSAILTKIKDSGAEVLSVYGGYADGATILKQALDLDLDMQLQFWGSCYTPPFIELVGEDGNGSLFMCSFDADMASDELQTFRRAYIDMYDMDLDSHAANTYDIARVFVKALGEVGPDRVALKDRMRNFTGEPCLSGGSFDMIDGDTVKPMAVVTIEDGAFTSYVNVNPSFSSFQA